MTNADTLWDMHANSLHGLTLVARALDTASAERVGSWLLFDSGTANADFNQALVTGPVASAKEAVGLALGWYEARGVPFSFWLRVPDDEGVIAATKAAGFAEQASQPAMLLPQLPARRRVSSLVIEPVVDEAGVEAYAAAEREEADRYSRHHGPDMAMARALLGAAGVRMFVGFHDGVPVARAMVVVHGAMAGVTNVYVAPSVRRRGYGEAITWAAINAGAVMGATASCLEATAMGEPLYRGMGFREEYRYLRLGR